MRGATRVGMQMANPGLQQLSGSLFSTLSELTDVVCGFRGKPRGGFDRLLPLTGSSIATVDPCEAGCSGGTAYQGCAVAGALVLKCADAAAVELGSVDCWPLASILQSIRGSIVRRSRRNGGV